MIGYVTLGTNDLERGAQFYDALFAVINAPRMMENELFIENNNSTLLSTSFRSWFRHWSLHRLFLLIRVIINHCSVGICVFYLNAVSTRWLFVACWSFYIRHGLKRHKS